MKNRFYLIYRKLYNRFGPQYWWPADNALEVMLGAVLTQNTSWANVEQAIANLKKKRLLKFERLLCLPQGRLSLLIRPAGYYNVKAKRLMNFLKFLDASCRGNIKKMRRGKAGDLRRKLLEVNGIGPETADSILLYALEKPVFVVDAYTKRIFSRHGFIKPGADYHQVQGLFMRGLKKDVWLFNEYHALLVRLGKEFCLKNKPKCSLCPLNSSEFYLGDN
ncbi:MAG: endonuclease III domain-containing protein [Candidatus Omnitrophota bacterium]